MKKTIYFSLVAFLIILGSSKVDNVSAQGKSEPKKVTTAHIGSYDTVFDLWCGENVVDQLSGTMNYHCTMQFENDVLLFMNMEYYGSFTGNSGEVFKYKEITKYDASQGDLNSNFHFNVIGNKGSHLIASGKYLNEEPWIEFDKAICR